MQPAVLSGSMWCDKKCLGRKHDLPLMCNTYTKLLSLWLLVRFLKLEKKKKIYAYIKITRK